MVGEDSFYDLGGILRAGKRGYALVHEPSVLKMCNVQPMVTFVTCQIGIGVGIFNVCLGNDKEASKVLQQFAAYHHDLRSDAIVEMGADIEWRLASFGAPYMNIYGAYFKFPDDKVTKSPTCIYGHDYTVDFEGSCKNCRLFWICCNISHVL
ncbi:hypothetical protein Bca52824_026817 [Brassica carinata]|uniref:Uncharacterized protein n=1 Tax=Brassica carinata TaxID=52824 RepID=A0A8X7SHC5_BRACI|nr:hypothetical protein Bca52824_026817 [Brassica carinata]